MLSIIIPTLNEEKHLPFLLESLKKQTFRDFEIIVADNHSKDRTREIALQFGCLVTSGGLPSAGRNAGARQASREWLLFLDADVLLPPDFLEKALEEIQEKMLDLATPFIEPLSQNKIDKFFCHFYNFYAKLTEPLWPHAPGFCIFVRKELFQKVGGFDENTRLAEDHDFIVKASRYGRFGLLTSVKIPFSVRRFEKDGRLNIALKYLGVEFHRAFLGPIQHDRFRYRFAHFDEKEKIK